MSTQAESIPLSGENVEYQTKKPGYFFSKAKTLAVVVILILLIVTIIILAVFLGLAKQKQGKPESSTENRQNDSTEAVPTTIIVDTQIPPVPTTAGTERWWNPRLPPYIVPSHYDLYLNITVDEKDYNGSVAITVDVQNLTDVIIVHSRLLNITLVQVHSTVKNAVMRTRKHFPFAKYEYHVIQMESPLETGQYVIKLSFHGIFHDSAGLFRDTYKRPNGKKVYFAATQFQETFARQAFPCFDEPAMKATFNVTIAHRPDYIALSNMPVYKKEMVHNQKVNYYRRTVLMSTYLLAFVVGDFNSTEVLSSNDIKMRYFSRPSFVSKLEYAKSVGGRIMTYFEKLFDVEYPLPKEDMTAIPDLAVLGMEHWGLITYYENSLLIDPKESSEENKIEAVSLITHELAHMWFGNIVTMKWWNDLWLNEGFAEAVTSRAVEFVEPDWKNEDAMIYLSMPAAMTFDTHSYSVPLSGDPSDHAGMAGVIVYNKAHCILRMLESILGEKTFLNGVKIYLKRHLYRSVVKDDLWKAMSEASCSSRDTCKNIKQIMDPWTLQIGFPEVTFKKKNSTHYTVIQSHYKQNETYNKSPFGYKWVIPLSYTIKNKGRRFTWMNMTSATIEWDGKGWIKANTDHSGYYVTSYDERNWLALAEQLKENHTVFSSSDRAGMLLDLFQFTSVKQSYSTMFSVIEYMANETEFVPWKVMFQQKLGLIDHFPITSPARKSLSKYFLFLGKKQYERLGFEDTGTSVDKVLRKSFLNLFCKAGVETCRTKLYQLFRTWMKDPDKNPISPNIRDIAFYIGIQNGGVKEWDFLYNQYNKTKNAAIKDSIMYGLSASREPWIIERYLSYAMDEWRFEYRSLAIRYICGYNSMGTQITWGFLRANLKEIEEQPGMFSTFLRYLVPEFRTKFSLQQFQSFQKQHNKDLRDHEHKIEKTIDWLEKNEQNIEDALRPILARNYIE